MHGLRSALLKGEKVGAAAAPSTEEECRRKGPRDPSRPASDRVRPERRVVAQRQAKRHREIVERATIVYQGKKSLVRVVNISATGLTIESAIVPGIGESLIVELPGGPVEGVVRWLRRGRIGVDVGEAKIALA